MPLKIIYLDDEPEICENFFDLFSSEDVEIKTFTDPQMAIIEANQNPPDLIFLDYRMPGITGDQVAQEMSVHIPKYLVTGEIDVKTDYNFNRIISKPTIIEDMRTIIETFLNLKK